MCYKNKTIQGSPCQKPTNLFNKTYPSVQDSIKPHAIFKNCITFNSFGNITSDTIVFKENSLRFLYVFVHEKNDLVAEFVQLALDFRKSFHHIQFSDKMNISRLPTPFPSNCSSGQYNDSIFPGKYTYTKCKHTCSLRNFISKCGAVPDMWLRYAPHIKTMLPSHDNRTAHSIRRCMLRVTDQYQCQCRVGCQEVSFKVKHFADNNTFLPQLSLQYLSNTYTEITETPAYPATKFVTDIGGWLGLFSGMSLLSLVEVLLSGILSILAISYKLKYAFTARRIRQKDSSRT